jgi:hypothetical protein
VTGPDSTDSQADRAGSIPVTRSTVKPQVSACSSGSFVILQVLTLASRAINFAEVLNLSGR